MYLYEVYLTPTKIKLKNKSIDKSVGKFLLIKKKYENNC